MRLRPFLYYVKVNRSRPRCTRLNPGKKVVMKPSNSLKSIHVAVGLTLAVFCVPGLFATTHETEDPSEPVETGRLLSFRHSNVFIMDMTRNSMMTENRGRNSINAIYGYAEEPSFGSVIKVH